MSSTIKTVHSDYNHRFYFLPEEKREAIGFSWWCTLLLVAAYVLINYIYISTDSPNPAFKPAAYKALMFMGLFWFSGIGYLHIWPAFSRGKFLRNNGYCVVTPDGIEAHCLGKVKRYQYKDRSIKTKHHKDGSVDIFIGKSFMDMFIHSSHILSPKFYEANNALRGFGAPLYRVTNVDEVLAFLEAHK